ncbi:DeoR/GlpR family DNA-binding transcription regulator [Jiangella muralis]|uniref:DeoR/GlpR family DNA-binding transcription regulator n=1 Tax=Jiangella muralis TaxID=702383 RepID=UPI00069E1993|nr:DeoR/GlpR family DNA-binding transcription regulator [Jiangella muralis]
MTESISSGRSAQALARRRDAVLSEILAGNGNVSALSERLGVSEATIRRDLAVLSREGKTTRTYGGAVGAPRRFELSLHEKEALFEDRKEAIARRAAAHIDDGDTLIFDAGTTIGQLATHLGGFGELCVITNGISSIFTLASAENVELISLGGSLRHISQAFLGPLAETVLRHLSADVAFLGANGLGPFGLCCPTTNHAGLKSLMASRASRVYLLADSSKIGQAPHRHWAPFQPGWTLVTDSNVTPAQIEEVRSWGLHIEIAAVDATSTASDGAIDRANREEEND